MVRPIRRPPSRAQRSELTQEQREALERLRAIAMELAFRIMEMVPKDRDAAVPANGMVKPLPLEYDRLLGRNDGVIDSFNTLVKIVIRLLDVEREYIASPFVTYIDATRVGPSELDRRIAAELDFIVEQRRAEGSS